MRHLLLFALVAGCSRPNGTGSFQLRIAAASDLAPVGPHATGLFNAIAQDWVYEPLAHLQADGTMTPALASRWERVEPKSFRVWIRSDARFSDGSTVGANDVVESVRSLNLRGHEQDGAIVIESDTVVPETVLSRALIYKRGPAMILGSGPFSVVEQDPSQIVLRRNVRLPNHIDQVVIRSFGTAREAFLRTLAGDADAYPFVDPRQLEFFEGVPRFQVIRGPSLNAFAVSLSTKRLDRDLRRALVEALRGPELARMAYPDGCAPLKPDPAPPSESLPPGRPLSIGTVLKAASHLERMALAVQRMLGPRGGDIEDLSLAEHERRLATGDFDLLIELPIVWPQSEMAMLWHSHSVLSGQWYSNARVDAAIDSGDWAGAMREVMDDPPVEYICLPERLAIVDARIKNARIGPYGFLETLPEWEVAR